MKLIIDKGNDGELVKERNQEKKESKERYIVAKNNDVTGKQIGTLFLGIVGGVIGGMLSTLVVMDVVKDDTTKPNTGTTTNSTLSSYNFTTVENPVVAISFTEISTF